jgi:hypothetical protein
MRSPGPTFDPELLASVYAQLPARAWAKTVSEDDVVNPGYQFAPLIQQTVAKDAARLFRFVLDEFAPVWTAWLAKVPAFGFIGPHIDEGPYRERWHVPVLPSGTFDGFVVEAGVSFPVKHWVAHRVDNPTDSPRVHLVVDRDVWVGVPYAPFQRIEDP